jgi:hypothetical protein
VTRIWDDVKFDHTAASEAVSALTAAAAQLDRISTDRAGHAKHAREDWSGMTRIKFDQALDPALSRAGDLATALRRAAGMIQQAMADAATEQHRRLHARASYTPEITHALRKHRP